jgi:SET domain-containing protein
MMSDSIVYVADSPIHGKGLFARSFIPSGTVIGVVQGQPTTDDGDHVLWIDGKDGFHVQCDLRYINHSNTPDAAYHNTLEVCAIRDIHPGDEITHYYGADWEE